MNNLPTPQPSSAPKRVSSDEATEFVPRPTLGGKKKAVSTDDATQFSPRSSGGDDATQFVQNNRGGGSGDDATQFVPRGPSSSDEATQFTPAAKWGDDATQFTPAHTGGDDATQFTPATGHTTDDATQFVSPKTASQARAAAPAVRSNKRKFSPGDIVANGKYRVVEEIETAGREAIAYMGEAVLDGTPVFIKQLVEARSTESDRQKLAELRDKLVAIENDFCLRCFDIVVGEQVLQVFEYLPNAVELRDLVRSEPATLQNEMYQLLWQLTQGVGYLHHLGIVHRDLKPSNIMVLRTEQGLRLKVVDYGTISLVGDAGEHTTFAGSRHYAPPEALKRKFQSRSEDLKKYDWWSVGRVAQEILCGCSIADLVGRGISTQSGQRFSGTDVHFEEIMLEERIEHYQCRAGMVELVEAQLGKDNLGVYRQLMRGLLTTSVDDRWTYNEVLLWFQNTPPADGYDKLPEHGSTAFRYQGKNYTLGEIARTLATAEHWAQAQKYVFQGMNAAAGEKSLFDYIHNDVHDKILERELDDITSLPNPRKLANRELFDAVEDYSTGLALSRMGKSGNMPLALHLRGLPVTVENLLRWSRSTVPLEQRRAVALTHAPLVEALQLYAPELHKSLAAGLGDFKKTADIIAETQKTTLTTPQLAKIFSLVFSSRDELIQNLEIIRKQYHAASYKSVTEVLTGDNKNPNNLELAFIAYTAAEFPNIYTTHEQHALNQQKLLRKHAYQIAARYVWLNVADVLSYRSFFLGSFYVQAPVHFFAVYFYAGLLMVLLADTASADNSMVGRILIMAMALGCSHAFAMLTLRAVTWSSMKNYVVSAFPDGFLKATGKRAEFLDKVGKNPDGKYPTKRLLRQEYTTLQQEWDKVQNPGTPAVKLAKLPEMRGAGEMSNLFLILLVFTGAAPAVLGVLVQVLPFPLLLLASSAPLALVPVSLIIAVVTGSFLHPKWELEAK